MPRSSLSLLPALFLVGLLGAACGASGDETSSVGGGSPAAAWPSPPVLGEYVTALTPPHGGSIRQHETRTLRDSDPKPPCFVVDLSSLDADARWFRVSVDGGDATLEIAWRVPAPTAADQGVRGCVARAEGLAVGRHLVEVTVRDPENPRSDPIHSLAWAFDVVP